MAIEITRRLGATITTAGTLTAGQHTPVDATAGTVALTLPSGVNNGAHLSVEKRDATTNTVTITGSIRGATSTLTLVWQYESVTFRSDGTTWVPTEGHKTKAALDGAYAAITGTPAVLTWDTGTSNYLPAALKASAQPKEFRGPTDPATVSGVTLHTYDLWTKTGF